MSGTIEQLNSLLEEDSKNPFPKYPQVAVHLLSDPRVSESVARHLDNGDQVINITSLGYNFYTGLQAICFRFSSSNNVLTRGNDLLVIADGDCGVVGTIDRFDHERPNPKLPPLPRGGEWPFPPLPEGGERPFALARPSASLGMPVPGRDLYPLEVRSREFFKRLQMLESGSKGTRCTYESAGGGRYCVETTENPLGGPDMCDEWDDRVVMDTTTDDC